MYKHRVCSQVKLMMLRKAAEGVVKIEWRLPNARAIEWHSPLHLHGLVFYSIALWAPPVETHSEEQRETLKHTKWRSDDMHKEQRRQADHGIWLRTISMWVCNSVYVYPCWTWCIMSCREPQAYTLAPRLDFYYLGSLYPAVCSLVWNSSSHSWHTCNETDSTYHDRHYIPHT